MMFLSSICICIAVVYGWFQNSKEIDPAITGYSKSAYFASGNGSEQNPFIITRTRHLYNLAWLQYLGTFNELDGTNVKKQYYFELGNDIDMTDFPLPPIGTEENPFVGNFNGNGYVVSNLTVYNQESYFDIKPTLNEANRNKFGSIVGMFGVVGLMDESFVYSRDIVEIKNLYLDNISIKSLSQNTLVGLLAGYVNGSVNTVGIHYSNLGLINSVTGISSSVISKYTLIGDYDANTVNWINKPGGSIGYDSSTDIGELLDRIHLLNGSSSNAIEKSQSLPFRGEGEFITSSGVTSQAGTADNIGYFTGSDLKVYSTLKSNINTTDYYYPVSSGVIKPLPYTNGNITYPAPGEKVKKATFLSDESNFYTIRLQSKLDIDNNRVTIDNGRVGSYQGKIIVPQRCVWVAPQIAGTMEFVLVNPSGDGENFTLSSFKRETKGDYSSRMTGLQVLIDTNYQGKLLSGYAYYFTYEITQSMIDEKMEFALSRDNGTNGAYFWYLNVGASGSSVSYTNNITGVDFVYTSLDNDGNIIFSGLDNSSNIVFEIKGISTAVFNIYFRRKYFSEEEIAILYFASSENIGLVFAPNGSGMTFKASDLNVNSK